MIPHPEQFKKGELYEVEFLNGDKIKGYFDTLIRNFDSRVSRTILLCSFTRTQANNSAVIILSPVTLMRNVKEL